MPIDFAKWEKEYQKAIKSVLYRIIETNAKATLRLLKRNLKKKGINAVIVKTDTIDPLLAREGQIELRFDVLNPNVIDFVNQRTFRFSFDINEYTMRELKHQLNRAFEEGESIDKIKERMKIVFGFGSDPHSNYRAKRIARSEVIRASNYGQEQAYVQSGVVEAKEWFTALDERTCPACSKLNGRVIGLNQNYFNRGDRFEGFKLDYEDIKAPPLHPNCRCTIIPVIKEEFLSDEFAVPELPNVRVPEELLESAFARGRIVRLEPLETDTLNECEIAEIEDDGRGLFKSEVKEREKCVDYYYSTNRIMNLKNCSMVKREYAVSELDKILELGYVPETVLKKSPAGEIGSTQYWVENGAPIVRGLFSRQWGSLPFEERRRIFLEMGVFDDLISNINRHNNNIMFDLDSGRWKLVDNGASFAHTPQRAWNGRFLECAGKRFLLEDADKLLPECAEQLLKVYLSPNSGKLSAMIIRHSKSYIEIAKKIGSKVLENKAKIDALFKEIKLTQREINAFWGRAKAMAEGKMFEYEVKMYNELGATHILDGVMRALRSPAVVEDIELSISELLAVKGGPGSGSWDAPGKPRFQWTPKEREEGKREVKISYDNEDMCKMLMKEL